MPALALAFLLVLTGSWAYSASFAGALVLDDIRAIVRNPTIRTLWPLSIPLQPPSASTVAGRPVANLTFAVNYALAPADARDAFAPGGPGAPAGTAERFVRNIWGYHFLNLCIHLAASLVLFGVVRRTLLVERWRGRFETAAPWLALVVAVLWLVHPLQTESVTYVVQRVESLVGLFYLLTIYCAIRAGSGTHVRAWSGLAIAACALGMATKEMMVTAPVTVWLWDRIFGKGDDRRSRWPFLAGLAATWLVLGALVMNERRAPSIELGGGMSWLYLLTQAEVIAHYLRLAVVGSPLVILHTWPIAASIGAVWPQALLVTALAVLAMVGVVRRHPLGFAGAWFFLILAPTSSVLPIVTEVAAEHRMYLPLAAVVALAVIGAFVSGKAAAARFGAGGGVRGRAGAIVGAVLALALVAAYGAQTRARNLDYSSDERLWYDAVSKQPGNSRARVAYGAALLSARRFADAETQLRAAVALDPADPAAWGRLGAAQASQGKLDEALPSFERALVLRPDDPDAHRSLGQLHAARRRDRLAVAHFGKALDVVQDDPALIAQLAAVLADSEDPAVRDAARAVELAERATRLTSRGDPMVLNVLAAAQAAAGRLVDAATTAEEGLSLARAQGNQALAKELEMRVAAYRARPGPWLFRQ